MSGLWAWARRPSVAGPVAVCALVLLVFRPYWVSSGSMKPSLLIGDFLLVNMLAYGVSGQLCPFDLCPGDWALWQRAPRRGDIAVFRHPDTGVRTVKRVIALPGDTVALDAGRVVINARPLDQRADGTFVELFAPQGRAGTTPRCANGPVGLGGICRNPILREGLPNGRSYRVLDTDTDSFADTLTSRQVPEGQYFVLGDNRDNSIDSRYARASGGLGFVPQDRLVGRAGRVVFSSAGRSLLAVWTWRMDRIWKKLE